MVPGQKPQGNTFIKKPFVAPPPMSNSYVPPPKQEPAYKPYIREEDPEIRRRLEEDRAAAESAGLTGESAQQYDDEDAPKPTSLKDRIARLQQQQMEQAQRRAEGGQKEKKKPAKKPSETSEQAEEAEGEEMQRERSVDTERQSLDVSREKPRVPSAQRRPTEPMSPIPAAPDSELVSDGNEADHSAAGETTEDDAGTIGPEDSDEIKAPTPAPPRRASTAPKKEADVGDEEDTTEDAEEDEDSMDEETRRKLELRERMAKMSGGMGMAGMFGPPGGMPMPGGAPPKKRSTKERKASEDVEPPPTSPSAPAQRIPMIPVPGMNRVQSPESDQTQRPEEAQAVEREDEDDEEPPMPPTRRSTHEERAPPPVPKGKTDHRSKRTSTRNSKFVCQTHLRDLSLSSSDGAAEDPGMETTSCRSHDTDEHS